MLPAQSLQVNPPNVSFSWRTENDLRRRIKHSGDHSFGTFEEAYDDLLTYINENLYLQNRKLRLNLEEENFFIEMVVIFETSDGGDDFDLVKQFDVSAPAKAVFNRWVRNVCPL